MSLLCDRDIFDLGVHAIDPFIPDHVNPASYDLTLSPQIRLPQPTSVVGWDAVLDVRRIEPDYTIKAEIDPEDGHRLNPGEFLLASSEEVVQVPHILAARVEGKSSLGRIGLAVHITAGYIDPGFHGHVTLEIANLFPRPIILRSGMRIAQMAFFRMTRQPAKAYNVTGHYQGQRGPTESRFAMPETAPAAYPGGA